MELRLQGWHAGPRVGSVLRWCAGLACALVATASMAVHPASHGVALPLQPRVGSVPVGARGLVSRTIGRDEAAYQARSVDGRVVLQNPAQHLVARFAGAGVALASGGGTVRMALAGY